MQFLTSFVLEKADNFFVAPEHVLMLNSVLQCLAGPIMKSLCLVSVYFKSG